MVDCRNAVVDKGVDGEVLGNDQAQAPDCCEIVKREVIKTELMTTFQILRPHIQPTSSKPIAAAVNLPLAAAVNLPLLPQPMDITAPVPVPPLPQLMDDVTAPQLMDDVTAQGTP